MDTHSEQEQTQVQPSNLSSVDSNAAAILIKSTAASANYASNSNSHCDSKSPEKQDLDDSKQANAADSKLALISKLSAKVSASAPAPQETQDAEAEESGAAALDASNGQQNSLSVRAERVKKQMLEGSIVDAVVLNRSGIISQIRYNTTPALKQANVILNGRPTIIGEFEEIGVIIVRPMHDSCGCHFGKNSHRLPYPFQSEEYCGDYLLYKVSEDGNPTDFSASAYREFEISMRSKTEEAHLQSAADIEQSNIEENEEEDAPAEKESFIPRSQDSCLQILRRDVERRVRLQFQSKIGREGTTAEVDRSVNATVDELIESMISADGNDDADDEDYSPNEDIQLQLEQIQENTLKSRRNIVNRVRQQHAMQTGILLQDSELVQMWQSESEHKMSVSEFREEMNAALDNVRRLGRLHGQQLASSLAETFYEINGREPEVNEVTSIFRRIKESLAIEANEASDVDDGSAQYLADSVSNDSSRDQLVEYANRLVTEDLIIRGRQKFFIENGRKPNSYELRLIMVDLFQSLVVENPTDVSYSVVNDSEALSDSEYNPENQNDQDLLAADEKENSAFEEEVKEELAPDLPTSFKFLSTPAKRKKNAVQYDVYFKDASSKKQLTPQQNAFNVEHAKHRFARVHNRAPTAQEVQQIQSFLSVDASQHLSEIEVNPAKEDAQRKQQRQHRQKARQEQEQEHQQKSEEASQEESANHHNSNSNHNNEENNANLTNTVVLTTPIKNKKNAAVYNLFFDATQENASQNNERGLEWFQRILNRNPTVAEMSNLSQFLSADKSTLIKQVVNFDDEQAEEADEKDGKQEESQKEMVDVD